MASVTSGEVQCSTYIVARAYVEYSGNSATAYIQYKHTYGGYCGYSGSGTYGAGDASSTWSWSGQCVSTSWANYMSIGFSISKSGGDYTVWCSGYSYNDFSVTVSIPRQYNEPSGVSGSNIESDGTPQKAHLSISVGSWGNYDQGPSDARPYQWYSEKVEGTDYRFAAGSDSTVYWTGAPLSTTSTACAITKWYPRAKNNHDLYAWGGVVYIASPTAPTVTATGAVSTSPSMTVSGSVMYKGGSSNSIKADFGTMKNWRLYCKKESDSSYTEKKSNMSNATSFTFGSLPDTTFELSNNYNIQVKATNTIGGTGATTKTAYCPTGVSGTTQSKTTTSLTLRASATSAGAWTVSSGNMACYEIKWSTTKATVDSGGGTSTGRQTSNTFTISGLGNGQTIYYRVYGWNEFGLSNVSNTITETTIPRYNPEIGIISFNSKNPGANVVVPISHTGGATRDELPVTSLTLSWKPANSSSWSTLKTATGLNITAGQSYTFTNAWTTDVASEGDYDFKVVASNGTDTSEKNTTLQAPISVVITNVSQVSGKPNQLKATAKTTAASTLYKYKFTSQGGGSTRSTNYVTSATTYTATTVNYLLFNTQYAIQATAYNVFGLWRKSSIVQGTTPKRFEWYYRDANSSRKADLSLRTATASKNITEVYYIVKNALGNTTTGQSMNNKRLKFITQPLHYRPENVATINFSNGKKLAYALDSNSDTYKFGIWSGSTIQTTFFDGTSWSVSEYVFPSGYTVSSITSYQSKGLNSSAAFSTTTCETIPLWERQGS